MASPEPTPGLREQIDREAESLSVTPPTSDYGRAYNDGINDLAARLTGRDRTGRALAASPAPEPTPGLREALHFKADLLQRDDSRDYSHQVVRLADVHSIIDEALPARREPRTYRTPEGGVEVIVDIPESASWVEDQFPDEVAYLIRAALAASPAPEPTAGLREAFIGAAHDIHEMAVSIGEEGYDTLHKGAFVECQHPTCIANRAVLDAALAASPAPEPSLTVTRWIDSLHEDANGLVWITRNELRSVLATAAPEPTGLDAALFREMAQRMHDALIPLDSQPLHPAVTWNVCTDPMCQAARRALNGTDTGETGG